MAPARYNQPGGVERGESFVRSVCKRLQAGDWLILVPLHTWGTSP